VGNSGSNIGRIAIEIFRPDPSNGSVLTAPLIANNSFSNWTDVDGMGISVTHGDGAVIEGNTIDNAAGPTQNTGIEVIVANAQVQNNIINGGFAQGIAIVGTAAPAIVGNMIANVTDSGIILACDNGRNRCASRNSVVSGNAISNARLVGIKLDNDWSAGMISGNMVARTAGFWPGDNRVDFSGIHQSPAPGPGAIDSNTIIQDSAIWPLGFWFSGIRLNSPMPGSSVTNNVVRSAALLPLGSGLIDNTGSAMTGWIITGNTFINIAAPIN
jgi:putative cofactor-binding repeat protein